MILNRIHSQADVTLHVVHAPLVNRFWIDPDHKGQTILDLGYFST
jgi:hypothetical protein